MSAQLHRQSAPTAIALATLAAALPTATPAARDRLACLRVAWANHPEWSADTIAAQALAETDWLAIARHLREPVGRLRSMDAEQLVGRLREPASRAA